MCFDTVWVSGPVPVTAADPRDQERTLLSVRSQPRGREDTAAFPDSWHFD